MGTSGIFSGQNCILRTLNFELIYPVNVPILEDFLDFSERVDNILHIFLQDHENLALKYSPRFNVDIDKSIYLSIFTLDLTPEGSFYQECAQHVA